MSRMTVSVENLMRQIESDVLRARRQQVLARGHADEYRDLAIFGEVDSLLRRAVEDRDHELLLLPHFLSSDADWQLSLRLRYASHRPVVGPLLLALKRRVLMPLTRWLYEFSLENFRRQRRINSVLFACIEELAIENARLRQALAGPRHATPAPRSSSEQGEA